MARGYWADTDLLVNNVPNHDLVNYVLLMGDINMEKIGQFLLSTDKFGYLLPFEAISVLLLACIIGGVVIARRR